MNSTKRILLFVLLVGFSVRTFAQSKVFGSPNLLKYDKRLFHFGIMLGGSSLNYFVKSNPDLTDYDYKIVETKGGLAFNIGIVTDLRMGKYFDLRLIPAIAVGDPVICYYKANYDVPVKPTTQHVYLDVPLLVKFKSSRMANNIRAYVIGGAQYSLDMTSNAKYNKEHGGQYNKSFPVLKRSSQEDEIYLLTKFHDFLGVAGVGFDFYCTYFKFAVELKMSFGIPNLLIGPGDPRYASYDDLSRQYVSSIDYLKSRNFQISITFE